MLAIPQDVVDSFRPNNEETRARLKELSQNSPFFFDILIKKLPAEGIPQMGGLEAIAIQSKAVGIMFMYDLLMHCSQQAGVHLPVITEQSDLQRGTFVDGFKAMLVENPSIAVRLKDFADGFPPGPANTLILEGGVGLYQLIRNNYKENLQ